MIRLIENIAAWLAWNRQTRFRLKKRTDTPFGVLTIIRTQPKPFYLTQQRVVAKSIDGILPRRRK